MNDLRLTGAVTIAAAPAGGKARPTFSGLAYSGAPMRPEGWEQPVIIDLAGVKVPSQHRPALRQHDPHQIVGHTTSVTVDGKGIRVKGVLSGEDVHVGKVAVPASNGFQWQMSVGANPVRTERLEAGETATVNGREITGPLTISRETEIGEISFVPLGADGATSATVKAQKGVGMDPFKLALKQLMADHRTAGTIKAAKYTDEDIDKMSGDECKAALKKAMKAAAPDEEEDEEEEKYRGGAKSARPGDVIKAMRADAAAEVERQEEIRARVGKHNVTEAEVEGKKVNLLAHAITAGWTPDAAELAALRASRPGAGVGVPGGLGYSTSTPEINEAVIEAAVMQAGRLELFHDDFFRGGDRGTVPERDQKRIQRELQARYPDQVQQAAHSAFRGRISLQQMLTTLARQSGYRGSEVIRDDGDIGAVAHHCTIRATGASTASLANVLSNVLNKFLLQGYLFTEQAWKSIAGIRSTTDFKPAKSVNLFGDFVFEKVGSSGELKHATLQDQAFANQVEQSGKIITISRKDIINDDLGALTTVPTLMGRGAGLYLNNLFWATFLNPGLDDGGSTNFFAATHTLPVGQAATSNLSTGGGSALASAGLTAAQVLFDNQVDPKGQPLGVDAEILLYPPELESAAMELMNSQFIIYGGASASRQGNTNVWKGRFTPVKSRYLNKTAFTGSSTTAWYLLANPGVLPVIEVAFLNGADTPTVQQAGPDFQFNILGISIRGVFDCGVVAQNFRGGVKSAGA